MGLIAHSRLQVRRLHHVWSWRLRYWWLDTEAGKRAKLLVFCLSVLVATGAVLRLATEALKALAHLLAGGGS